MEEIADRVRASALPAMSSAAEEPNPAIAVAPVA
jgi:hypothetical protein